MPLANCRLRSLSVDGRDVSRTEEGLACWILGEVVAVRCALRIFEGLCQQGLVNSGAPLYHDRASVNVSALNQGLYVLCWRSLEGHSAR